MSSRLLILLVCLGLIACTPVRRGGGGGGGDDDDSTDDDDDATDDDDDVSTDGSLTLQSEATGTVSLPARIGISRSEGRGLQVMLLAGAAVSCESFTDFTVITEEAWLGYEAGDLDVDTYVDILGNALLQLIGPASWAVVMQLDSSPSAADAVVDLQTGEWDEPLLVTIGRLAADTSDPDLLSEGNSSGTGGFSWEGQVNGWSDSGGLLSAFSVAVPDWGGPLEWDTVFVDGDVSASVCEVDLRVD